MRRVTSCTLGRVEAIDPEPAEPVREAILEALREQREPRDRWAAAALREGVGSAVAEELRGVSIRCRAPFHEHDVRSLW